MNNKKELIKSKLNGRKKARRRRGEKSPNNYEEGTEENKDSRIGVINILISLRMKRIRNQKCLFVNKLYK